MKKRHYLVTGALLALLPLVYFLGIPRPTTGKTGGPAPVPPAPRESAEERAKREQAEWIKATWELAKTSPAASHELWLEKERIAEPNPQMTPAFAAARLKEAAEIPDMMKRGMACREIISELCRAGYVSEAWGLIEKDHGKVRSQELDGFFGSMKVDLATFEARFKELNNKEENWRAMQCRLDTYRTEKLVSALMSPVVGSEFLALRDLEPEAFSNSVFNRLQGILADLPVPEREGRLSDAIALQQKGLLRVEEPVRLLGLMGDYDVFLKWQKFSDYTEGTDFGSKSGYIDVTRERFIGDMMRESSVQAVDLILKSGGTAGSRDLQLAMQQWSKIDSRGAMEWYEKNAATLGPEKQSSAAAGFFGLAYENGELDVARQWANKITQQKMREGALAAIDKKERELQGR
ncbi:MAG: hypothetical protein EOP88_20545 [Verrucomicrobiaceae bacterium]|nr:MAG: hypothetical protein EOP88_20545 [Verrucomicrobiaceae bacterium]